MPDRLVPVEPGETEPEPLFVRHLAQSHYWAARAALWKGRVAWAFTAGLAAGTLIAWVMVHV